MKLLLDMNLSPLWLEALRSAGHEPIHWSHVGPPNAPDSHLMAWAAVNHCVVMTHDLDFAALLAASQANNPSVLLLRTRSTLPSRIGHLVLTVLRIHQQSLETGVIVTLDEDRSRVRVLPLK